MINFTNLLNFQFYFNVFNFTSMFQKEFGHVMDFIDKLYYKMPEKYSYGLQSLVHKKI